jgi:hypothetical protein
MPQLSLYVDEKTLKIAEKMAKINKTSISKWVSAQIQSSKRMEWPKHFFDNFGALKDSNFGEISQLSFGDDIGRKKI